MILKKKIVLTLAWSFWEQMEDDEFSDQERTDSKES